MTEQQIANGAEPEWRSKLPVWIQPYTRPEMAAMLLLGFASGLPLYLVYQKTSFWLRLEGIERSTIGFFYWVGLAYSFKFVWAPIIDKVKIPVLGQQVGHRRSWMMVSIAGTVLGLLLISTADPSENLLPVTLGALILAFSGATLDVSIDAWRIESAPSERQANMAASYSLGYRGAAFFSGLGFVIADFSNWNLSFVVMALAMAICAGLILFIREPAAQKARASIDDLPFLAGPPNAVVVGFAFFLLARVLTLMGVGFDIVTPLAIAGVTVLWIGHSVFTSTRTPVYFRMAFALLGVAFIYAGYFWRTYTDLLEESQVLSLVIVLTNIILLGAVAGLIRHIGQRHKTPKTQARGKLYVMFATPFKQVADRYGSVLVPILVLVLIYRLSDFTMGVMASPLYADLGYAPAIVGGIQSGPGILSIIVGLFIGGLSAQLFGLMRSMIFGAILTLVTNGAYAWFAATAVNDPEIWRLAFAVCADNVAGGFVTTVFIAYLSSLVDPAYAATQYALFSSLYAFLNKFAAGFSGMLADAVGYVNFFLITASYAIPAALLVVLVMHLQKSQNGDPAKAPA